MIISDTMSLNQLEEILSDHVTVAPAPLSAFRALIAERFPGRDTSEIHVDDWCRAIDDIDWDAHAPTS